MRWKVFAAVLGALVIAAVAAVALATTPWTSESTVKTRVNACDFFTRDDAYEVLGNGATRVDSIDFNAAAKDCVYKSAPVVQIAAWRGSRTDFRFLTHPNEYAEGLENGGPPVPITVAGATGWRMSNEPDDSRVVVYENGFAFIVSYSNGPWNSVDGVMDASYAVVQNARRAS